ncbi:MAG: SEL1-like repeat protein [Verrucomicrobia bacterium]|nr:SEL1-like repeat protein [Verrucomicrobiota bacterium]
MKAFSIILLSFSFFSVSLFGQVTSPEEIVEKTVPKDQRTPPESPAPPPEAAPAPAVSEQPAQPQPVRVAPPVRPKTAEELREIEAKTIAFQTTRASDGSASAQYDLGIRFLKGNGVEQNETEARRWLEAAATQGNTLAIQKLAELNQQ